MERKHCCNEKNNNRGTQALPEGGTQSRSCRTCGRIRDLQSTQERPEAGYQKSPGSQLERFMSGSRERPLGRTLQADDDAPQPWKTTLQCALLGDSFPHCRRSIGTRYPQRYKCRANLSRCGKLTTIGSLYRSCLLRLTDYRWVRRQGAWT